MGPATRIGGARLITNPTHPLGGVMHFLAVLVGRYWEAGALATLVVAAIFASREGGEQR